MYVLGIDVGFYHMGLVGCNVSESFVLKNIDFCELVDITDFKCSMGVSCSLHHDKCIADYMSHLFKNYDELFNKADIIIIERQPPMGLVAVQELLMFRFRNKSTLVSPNSMHSHFDMSSLDYEQRKTRVIKMTSHLLSEFDSFRSNERKHDLSDALCIIKYYLFKKNKKFVQLKLKEDWEKRNCKFIKNLNEFIYNPSNN